MNKTDNPSPGVEPSSIDFPDPSAAELEQFALAWQVEVEEVDPLLEELEMLRSERPSSLAQLRQHKAEIAKLEAEVIARRTRAAQTGPRAVGSLESGQVFVDAANAKSRRDDALWPLIQKAQRACAEPWRAHVVWATLYAMAQSGDRPYPLLGTDDDAVRWDYDGEDRLLTRRAFAERLRRERARLGHAKPR